MKHSLRLVVGILLCFSWAVTSLAADWTLYYGEAEQAGSKYYDKQSAKKLKNGLIEVSVLSNGTRGSNVSVYRVDCKGKRIQSMSTMAYPEKMGKGKPEPVSSTALPFKSLKDASELDPHKARIFDLVCESAK